MFDKKVKWRVKLSTGGGPFPPHYVTLTFSRDDLTEKEVIAFCNVRQRITGSYYVAVSAVLVEEDSTSGK